MLKANRVLSTPRTTVSESHLALDRICLSRLIRDPFVASAFRAGEDDGLAPDLVEIDHPKILNGGAAEVVPDAGRRIEALVED